MPSSAATLAEVCPSRAAFVQHVPQYGCVLSDEKMQAVLAGDLSGLIVHPAFTYLAQLLGCLMWQIQRQMFMFPQVEYEQLQLLLLAPETWTGGASAQFVDEAKVLLGRAITLAREFKARWDDESRRA